MPVYAQVSIDDYLYDFDYGIRIVEKIYSGFDIKVTSETRSSYEHVRDSVQSAIADGTSSLEDAWGCYLAGSKTSICTTTIVQFRKLQSISFFLQ